MEKVTTIGLLHPGEMGSMVGAAARANGLRVLWASDGRGGQTSARAAAAGLEDVKTLAPLVAGSQVILSICPPHAATDLARLVMARSFSGIYVDGNAVSPATGREIGKIVTGGGATFVDGGIIGPPPRARGTTRLYLSGAEAAGIAATLRAGPPRSDRHRRRPRCGLGAQDGLRRVYQGHLGASHGHSRAGEPGRRGQGPAGRMGAQPAWGGDAIRKRRARQCPQGVALHRRDGRDRSHVRGRRAARRLLRGRGRDLRPSRRLQGRGGAAVARRGAHRRSAGPLGPSAGQSPTGNSPW